MCIRDRISTDDLGSFDLVLTMDDANLSAVRSLALEAGPQATATIQPMLSYSRRFSETEVPDPYYGGEAGFEHVLDLLEEACSNLLNDINSVESAKPPQPPEPGTPSPAR